VYAQGIRVSCQVSFRHESGSEKKTPRVEEEECPYLVTEDWDTNVSFVIDPRVVDLRREFHLWVAADKANHGDRCNR